MNRNSVILTCFYVSWISPISQYPVSQEILSLGNIVAATIFPKEIVSL